MADHVDNLPRFTMFVLYVHIVHYAFMPFVQSRNIYAQNFFFSEKILIC